MDSKRVRQFSALLTLGSLSVACDSPPEEDAPVATLSPTSSNTHTSSSSAASTLTANTNSTSAGSTTTGSTSSASTSDGTSGGGASSSDSTAATDDTSMTAASSGTTGGEPPSGTPYVFTGSTDGSLRAFVMDPSDGSLTAAGSEQTGQGLDFVALGPDNRTLFIARESTLAAYTYDPASQSFSAGDETDTDGGGTYVNVDPSGGFVFVASYNEGLLSFFSYDEQSGFSGGETFEPGMNAHQVRIDAPGQHVYVPCLGEDHVAQYDLDASAGTLVESATATAPADGGPRHMVFHPSAPVAYVLSENSSEIHVYDLAENGALEPRADQSVYTAEDEQRHWSSDIQITPDGNSVYAVNRDAPEIVRFDVQADQSLVRASSDDLGAVVRAFAVDPAGGYLQVGGDDGNLVAYRIDPETGSLTETSSTPGLGDIHATIIRYLE